MGNRAQRVWVGIPPSPAIKGQTSENFLVKIPWMSIPLKTEQDKENPSIQPGKTLPTCWKVYLVGALGKGCGSSGVFIISHEGNKIAYSLWFSFPTTNNMEKYETLLLSLQLASSLRAWHVSIYSNSQVVVNQVNGTFQVKEGSMWKYLVFTRALIPQFEFIRIT